MPISLTSASPLEPNIVRAVFSEAFLQNSLFFENSNYAFRTRFGTNIPLRAKQIDVVSATTANIVLTDSMLDGGKYELTILNVSGSDGVLIQDNTNSAIFEGAGDPAKCFSIRKRVPQWWRTQYATTFHALLCATGDINDDLAGEAVTSEINQLARALSLNTADGPDLSVIGQNYGVTRPPFLLFVDDTFRGIIPVLATKRKTAMKIFYDALTVLLGDRSVNNWRIYEVEVNRFVIEIPADVFYGLGGGNLASATYLHTDATEDGATTYMGDYFLEDANDSGIDVGSNIIVLFQITAIEEIIDQIKAAGIEYEVVIIG